MSSKYRRRQKKLRRKRAKVEPVFNDEWDAMIFLVDFGVEVEYDHEIYIPHDHLPVDAIFAIDYLVDKGYVPMSTAAKPIGPTTSDYLKDARKTGQVINKPEKGDPDDDV